MSKRDQRDAFLLGMLKVVIDVLESPHTAPENEKEKNAYLVGSMGVTIKYALKYCKNIEKELQP
jgi:hypothetical protein